MHSMKYSKWKSQEMFASICRQLRQVSDLRWFPHRHACTQTRMQLFLVLPSLFMESNLPVSHTGWERAKERERESAWSGSSNNNHSEDSNRTHYSTETSGEIHTRQIRARLVRKKVDKVSYTVQSPWWFWLRRREQRLMNMYYSAGTCTNA